MVRLSMEAPIGLLPELSYITDFDFVLTHLCEESDDYLSHYQKMVKSSREVVLDNSVNELGEPVSIHQMNDIAHLLGPTYIIPPDHLNNLEATLGMLDDAVSLWSKGKVWPVIQGTSYEEVVECGKVLKDEWGFNTVCIPYDITLAHRSKLPNTDPNRASLVELAETRLKAISALTQEGITFNRYHLLGMNTLGEFSAYSNQIYWRSKGGWGSFSPEVSVDTGAPITNAFHNRKFGIDALVPKGIYFDYFADKEQLEPVREAWYWNICMLKGALDGKC